MQSLLTLDVRVQMDNITKILKLKLYLVIHVLQNARHVVGGPMQNVQYETIPLIRFLILSLSAFWCVHRGTVLIHRTNYASHVTKNSFHVLKVLSVSVKMDTIFI